MTSEGAVFEFSWQQPGMLIALIALSPQRPISRDILASALWPEDDGATSRLKLRTVIHRLRRMTEPIPGGFDALVCTDRGDFQLRSEFVDTDAAAFEAGVRRALGAVTAQERVYWLEPALSLYVGPLAPGVGLPRLDDERARLAALHRNALVHLARAHQDLGNWSTVSGVAEQAIAVDPTSEEAHLLLMAAFARMGQPSGVLRQFGVLEQILHDELGTGPSDETVTLFESLRAEANSIATHAAARGRSIAEVGRTSPTNPLPVPPSQQETDQSPGPASQQLHPPQVESPSVAPASNSHPTVQSRPRPRDRASRSLVIAAPALLAAIVVLGGAPRLSHLLKLSAAGRSAVVRTQSTSSPSPSPEAPDTSAPRPNPPEGRELRRRLVGPQPAVQPLPVVPAVVSPATADRAAPPASEHAAPKGAPVAPKVVAEPNSKESRKVPAPRVLWAVAYPPLPDEQDSESIDIETDPFGSVITTGFVRTTKNDVDFLTLKYSREGKLVWRRRYNGTGNDVDRARDLALDQAGNIYVVGSSDNGAGNDTSRLSGLDIVIVCYDPAGNELWSARYNGPDNGEEEPVRICVDRGGRVYVAGWSNAGKPGQSPRAEWIVLCYDGFGRLEWTRRESAERATFAADMVLCPDGDLCVAGHIDHTLRFVPNGDILVRRYGHDGQVIWERRYGSENNGDEHTSKLGVDAAGNLYVTGVTYTGDPIDAGGAMDIVTLKFDADGNRKWVQVFDGGLSMSDLPTGMAVDDRGQVYVAGRSAHRSWDYTMLCYASDGKTVWQRKYNGTASFDDCAVAVTVDTARNPIFTGFASSRTAADYCTLKLRPDGRALWRGAFDRAGSGDTAAAVAVDRENCVLVTGRSTGGGVVTSVTVKYFP